MNPSDSLVDLVVRWRTYLLIRGYCIYPIGCRPDLVRSHNSNKKRYLWLLFVGEQAIRRLSISEQAHIHQHIRNAKSRKEMVYVVVGFVHEPRRIIILPAGAALKAKCVRSDKGGIAWGD